MSVTASFRRIFIPLRKSSCPVFRLKFCRQHQFARTNCFQERNRSFSTSQIRYFAKDAEEFSLKYLYVNTSVDLWEECPHGLTFDVGYIDSHSAAELSDKVPVIVGLPGILETHEELRDLLLPFGKLGYRIVIPNSPGNKYTKGVSQPDEDIFTYSIEERSVFVKDFLEELGVNRVDMLVTSHCSVYAGLHLTLREPEKFRSLVMINPAGVRPSRIMRPTKNYKLFTKLWDSPILRVFLKGAIFFVRPFTAFKGWNLRKVITFSRSIAGTSFEEVKEILDHANMYERQRFVIYSDNDRLFEHEIIEEMVQRLRIPMSSIHVISDDDKSTSSKDSNQSASNVKRSAIDISSIQGVKFEGVKGDILTSKASVIKKVLWDYMKTVKPDS